jgi:uncharacterized protein YfdQ (DUF2303 family)
MLTAETIQKIADLADGGRQKIATPDGGQAVVVPHGYQLAKMPPLEPPLTHIKQGVTLHTPQAVIDYTNAYKTSATRIFAEPGFLADGGKARVGVAFDYHRDNRLSAGAEDESRQEMPAPDRVAHKAVYTPRYSEAWDRWTEACGGKVFTQGEFAEFIEECRQDIVEPAAATLLDVVRMFKASKKQDFDSFMHEQSGSVKLHFSSEVQQQGSVTLPEMMKIGIPVYYRTDRVEMDVFIRFRLAGGKVVFFMKLDRPDRVEEHAFDTLTAGIRDATSVPLHNGRI